MSPSLGCSVTAAQNGLRYKVRQCVCTRCLAEGGWLEERKVGGSRMKSGYVREKMALVRKRWVERMMC
jgi:hypothetical protein